MQKIKSFLKLIRIKHYIKNLLIFFPLIFAAAFTKTNIITTFLGFLAFSFMASSIYIINDIRDIEFDKLHPVKKNRPLASGAISRKSANVLVVIMFLLSLITNYFVKEPIISYSVLFIYFSFNLLYSFGLKKRPIIDILLLVSFYVLRIYYGGAIIGIGISDYMFLTVTFAALYLTFGKRRNELKKSKESRDVLKFYNKEFLDKFMYLSLALTLVFYTLWIVEQNINYLIFSLIILFVIFLKYSLIVEGDSDGDPTDIIFQDKTLIIWGFIYIIFMILVMR